MLSLNIKFPVMIHTWPLWWISLSRLFWDTHVFIHNGNVEVASFTMITVWHDPLLVYLLFFFPNIHIIYLYLIELVHLDWTSLCYVHSLDLAFVLYDPDVYALGNLSQSSPSIGLDCKHVRFPLHIVKSTLPRYWRHEFEYHPALFIFL